MEQSECSSMIFQRKYKRQVAEIGAVLEIGRYAEQRMIYQDTDSFSDYQSRTLHIGIDLGIPAGNPFSPLEGEIFGFANHHTTRRLRPNHHFTS